MAEEKKKETSQGKDFLNKILYTSKNNLWMPAAVLLGILLVAVIAMNGGISLPMLKNSAGENMVEFLNAKVGGGVSLVGVESEGAFYKVTVNYNGQEIPVYMTKDGTYFVNAIEKISGGSAITGAATAGTNTAPSNVPKSAKPVVELFVMTHCPYGTQAEKGIIPAIKALGSKVDATIRFVHYFMHGDKEREETHNQVCIREEQNDKYLDYLECFLEAGDSAGCLKKTGVNTAKLNTCLESKAEDYYAEDSELSQGYGVQGSPTLIINGVESGAGRNPASYLSGICDAFTDTPGECDEEVSSVTPSPGFGTGASTSGTNSAQC